MSENTIHERLVSSAGVSALRKALNGMSLGLSDSQCILIDEVVSPLIRKAVVDAMRKHLPPPPETHTEA